MLRKFILFAFIASSFAPAVIKAAAEPLRSLLKSKILIVGLSGSENFLKNRINEIIAKQFDNRVQSVDNLYSPAEISAASCVLIVITPKSYLLQQETVGLDEHELFQEFHNRNIIHLFETVIRHPKKALIIHRGDRSPKNISISPALRQIFGQNIFQLTQPMAIFSEPNAPSVFFNSANHVVRDDDQFRSFKNWLLEVYQFTYPSRIEEPDYCYVPSEQELEQRKDHRYSEPFQKRAEKLANVLSKYHLDQELWDLLWQAKSQ